MLVEEVIRHNKRIICEEGDVHRIVANVSSSVYMELQALSKFFRIDQKEVVALGVLNISQRLAQHKAVHALEVSLGQDEIDELEESEVELLGDEYLSDWWAYCNAMLTRSCNSIDPVAFLKELREKKETSGVLHT